jgi:GH18 family chitinase
MMFAARIARRFAMLSLVLTLVGCSVVVAPNESASPTQIQRTQPFKVVGYVSPAANINEIDFSLLTHINYAFLIPRSNGTVRPFSAPNHLRKVVTQAKTHGVKVLIALGGCEPQLAGHVRGNLNVGNDRALLLAVLTQLLPLIGYPRTLNGLRVLDEGTR